MFVLHLACGILETQFPLRLPPALSHSLTPCTQSIIIFPSRAVIGRSCVCECITVNSILCMSDAS